MSKLGKKIKTNKFKFALSFVLIAILGIMTIGLAVKLNDSMTTKTLKASDYSVCALDSSGEETESDASLVSEFTTVDGLKCKLEEDADIEYKLFFYNADKEFIVASDSLSSDVELSELSLSGIDDAEFVRVQIMPKEDSEISFFEKSSYVKQLTVTVNK